jgi:cholesterol 7-dehydrogenase
MRGDDPDLRAKMTHKIPWVNEHKQKLFDQHLNKTNSKYIGVMYLDMYMKVLNFKPLFFFNATVFQVGPGLVYLFLISPYYEAVFFQHTSTLDKFEHDVFHELYASGYLPHCFTALMLRLEAQQVTNDTFIWNNKEFASNPNYNLDAEADVMILTWRRWFSQFYEGCAKREAEISKYSW